MTIDETEKIKRVVENKKYIEQIVKTVSRTFVEVFENLKLKIEDVDMFKLGYNKAIDDFSERIKQVTYTSGTESDGYYKIHAICERDIDEIAEQLKDGGGE